MAPLCPLCGKEPIGEDNLCPRCGYQAEGESAPDDRNLGSEETKRDLNERAKVILQQLENMRASAPGSSEELALMTDAIEAIKVPLRIEPTARFEFNDTEKRIAEIVTARLKDMELRGEVKSGPPVMYVHLGNMEFGLGNFGSAIVHYDKALLIQPNNLDAQYDKAVAHFFKKNYNEVLRCLRKILDRDPEHEAAICFQGLAEQLLEMGGE